MLWMQVHALLVSRVSYGASHYTKGLTPGCARSGSACQKVSAPYHAHKCILLGSEIDRIPFQKDWSRHKTTCKRIKGARFIDEVRRRWTIRTLLNHPCI